MKLAVVITLPAFVSARVPGWFATVPRGGTEHLYPDAVSNVAHAYAHLSHDKEAEDEHHVKSTSTKKVPSSKEEVDYHVEDFEDPFFSSSSS
mmetsp:Transcript_544/g.1278  ORF Transcript_544/g.1278 Transcript_544/m.1278 type:complete len:92 (+) Transcript_544:194-469(+)